MGRIGRFVADFLVLYLYFTPFKDPWLNDENHNKSKRMVSLSKVTFAHRSKIPSM
jgi:hypothetical protein